MVQRINAKSGQNAGAMVDPHPYARLTPDVVLDALEALGLRCDGRLFPLNSYENRVYQVGLADPLPPLARSALYSGQSRGHQTSDAVVAKFYRPARWSRAQILEEHAFALELAENEIPVVAPLAFGKSTLFEYDGFLHAVYAKQGGRAPELEDERTLEWLGRFIGRIHAVGGAKPFRKRPALDIERFGREPFAYLKASGLIPPDLATAWNQAATLALEAIENVYARVGKCRMIRVHGDCHAGNILWRPDSANEAGGPHFVDLDDSSMAPAVQDLWMLVSGDRATMGRQLGRILEGYERFAPFDERELGLVEALRTLRLLHYCAWLARRWDDPAFPLAFPWFNTTRYWQDRVLELREQIAAMHEPPIVPA